MNDVLAILIGGGVAVVASIPTSLLLIALRNHHSYRNRARIMRGMDHLRPQLPFTEEIIELEATHDN